MKLNKERKPIIISLNILTILLLIIILALRKINYVSSFQCYLTIIVLLIIIKRFKIEIINHGFEEFKEFIKKYKITTHNIEYTLTSSKITLLGFFIIILLYVPLIININYTLILLLAIITLILLIITYSFIMNSIPRMDFNKNGEYEIIEIILSKYIYIGCVVSIIMIMSLILKFTLLNEYIILNMILITLCFHAVTCIIDVYFSSITNYYALLKLNQKQINELEKN